MPAVMDDVTASERADVSGTIVYTTLYDLIDSVNDAITPGEEACVVPIVAHLLRTGHARFLRDVKVDRLWVEAPADCLAKRLILVANWLGGLRRLDFTSSLPTQNIGFRNSPPVSVLGLGQSSASVPRTKMVSPMTRSQRRERWIIAKERCIMACLASSSWAYGTP